MLIQSDYPAAVIGNFLIVDDNDHCCIGPFTFPTA